MDSKLIIEIISQAGGLGAVVLFVVFGYKGYIRWNREVEDVKLQLEAMRKERDDWRELALRGTELADKLTSVTERRVFGDK